MKSPWAGLVLGVAIVLRAATVGADPPACAHRTLDNGLEVFVCEDHRTPRVSVEVRYHVGSDDDPPGRSGFAHLFEHLTFRGSRHVADGELMRIVARVGGGAPDGETRQDSTRYTMVLPAEHLDTALWLESDRMGFLLERLDPSTFDTARTVVENELRERREDQDFPVNEAMQSLLFPAGHPHHRSTLGRIEDLDAATLDEARRFFRAWYVPDNATVAIVGDVSTARAMAAVERWFGPIPRGHPPVRPPVPEPVAHPGSYVLELDAPAPRLVLAWAVPAAGTADDRALDGVQWWLGDLLDWAGVHGATDFTAMAVHHPSVQRGSVFFVSATCPPEVPSASFASLIDELLRRGPADDRALRYQQFHRVRAMVASQSLTRFGGDVLFYAPTSSTPWLLDGGAPAVFGSDLRAAIARWLTPGRRLTLRIVPTRGGPLEGRLRPLRAGDVP